MRDAHLGSGLKIIELLHTEAGEGKEWVDADCALHQIGLKDYLDSGKDLETAEEIYLALEHNRRKGDLNLLMKIDRRKMESIKADAISGIDDFQSKSFNSDGSVLLRECGALQTKGIE